MADNKVKFLRGTSAEYEAKTKDNDTFYYTTDTKKLYLGETEITGIEIDDTSTTATDKTWSAKKISDNIPAELPANGGNADTVDDKHASDFSQIINLGDISTDTKTAIGIQGKTTTYWCSAWTDYPTGLLDGQGVIIAVNYKGARTAGINSIWCRQIFISPHATPSYAIYQRIINNTTVTDWVNIADGGNAATVNGLTVQTAVPANAKFTDTTYSLATSAANGLMSANDKLKLNYTNIAYATCDTAADISAKVATISGNSKWSLAVGSIVTVKFSATNTASNCTLNINETGAKQIWYHASVHTGNSSNVCGIANAFITFMYDGTYWVWIGHSNDNYPGYASATAAGIVSTGTQHFAGYKIFPTRIAIKTTGTVGTQPTSDINSAMYFSNTGVNASFGEIRNCIRSSSVTTGEVFTSIYAYSNDRTGSNTIKVVATNNNSGNYVSIGNPTVASSVSCLRKLSSGTTEATWDSTNSTGNCPPGAWYGKHS